MVSVNPDLEIFSFIVLVTWNKDILCSKLILVSYTNFDVLNAYIEIGGTNVYAN